MTDFVDNTAIASTKLTDGVEVIIFEFANFCFLGEKSLQSFPLLLIQVQLPQHFG